MTNVTIEQELALKFQHVGNLESFCKRNIAKRFSLVHLKKIQFFLFVSERIYHRFFSSN